MTKKFFSMSRKATISTSASEDRLESLIRQRLAQGADKARIDRHIWDLFGEEWCVMFTDLSGFSRKVAEFGIIHFLQTIYESEQLMLPVIEEYDGILLKSVGDSLLVIFRNATKTLQCALAMQEACARYNQMRLDEEKVLLCIGLGCGPVLRIGDTDVFGAEVNAASKLGEDVAKAGEILVTGLFKAASEPLHGVTDYELLTDTPHGTDSAYRVHYRLS